MSLLNAKITYRLKVWIQWLDWKSSAICPACRKNIIYRDCSDTWESEHIFKKSLGGETVLPNLIPICKDCNRSKLNKSPQKCPTTYDYMAKIGTIKRCDVAKFKKNQREVIKNFLKDPYCEKIKNDSFRCSNMKGGKDNSLCWIHIKQVMRGYKPMDISNSDECHFF